MRRIIASLALMLLVIGMVLVPASPVSAKTFEPGDSLYLTGEFVGTVTQHNVHYFTCPPPFCGPEPVIIIAPDYISVNGLVFLTENVGSWEEPDWHPVGVAPLTWSFNVIGQGADQLATVGNVSGNRTNFNVVNNTVISSASVTSGKGLYKELLPNAGQPLPPLSRMTLSLPIVDPPTAPGTYVRPNSHGTLEMWLQF